MSAVLCRVCTAKTDAYLCRDCTRQLEQAIAELPALLTDLDITTARMDRGVAAPLYAMAKRRMQQPGVHYTEGDYALPATGWAFAWDASNLAWTARQTLATWCKHLANTHRIPFDLDATDPQGPHCSTCRHTSCEALRTRRRRDVMMRRDHLHALWMVRHIPVIRIDAEAAQLHDELTWLRAEILTAVDRQDPDIYAGPCDAPDVRVAIVDGQLTPTVGTCGAELYARDDDTDVKCPHCGAIYDLGERRKWMRAQVDDEWARPHDIANALTKLDEPLRPDTLRKWIERDAKLAQRLAGRVPPYPLVLQVGIDDAGHAVYRVGDVRDRIAAMLERREKLPA